ncbi:MAG TPA: ABC transporter permease [Oscillospiraceae bacterium]|nr:ABC transporter permease [Oscillospiraceae bacterium]
MIAIFRRELGSYFSSPVGYAFLAIFYIFSGLFLKSYTLARSTTDLSGVFVSMFTILVFLVPVLTMRLMSEEKRQKTDQLLLTSPVTITGIVVGKFLAAFLIFSLGVAVTLVYAVVLSGFGAVSWSVVFGNIVGMLLLGAAFIAIGIFVSSLTENQIIAAVGGFAILMIFMLIDMIAAAIPIKFLSDAVYALSFTDKYNEFAVGIFNFSSVLFFISFAVVFNFLTIRVLERRRWA